MTRYFKYIFISLIACIWLASCVEKLEMPKPVDDSQEVTLVPRVKGFTNQYITKGSYSDAEFKIKRLAVLIFNSEGNLAFSKEYNTSSVVLNKTMLNLSSATVVMFANVSLSDIKKQTIAAEGTSTWTDITTDTELTLEGLDGYSIDLGNNPVVLETELGGDAFNGFPMKGVASNVNLTSSASDAVEVSLQILYAKINFEIGVAAGTENQNYQGVTPSFTPSGYSVTNVPTSTPVKELNDDEANGVVESTPIGTAYKYTGTQSDQSKTVNTNTATFTFYMAESRYNHGGIEGVYPVNLPEENKQQYKPLLATNGTGSPATGMATYVTVNGTYKDYRGTDWTVNYKVYLGKNNSDNFHVDRNSEYTNILTIKGIRNNSGYGTNDVWIDHRVDVTLPEGSSSAADCITITRETLIDAHIEVRPLRVKLNGSGYTEAAIYLPKYPKDGTSNWVQLDEIMGGNNENWIAIENNNGKSNKGRLYLPNGKRKYFTTSLIEELHAESSEIKIDSEANRYIPLKDGDCAWIYFDENSTSNTRQAKIDVVFSYYEGDKKFSVTESYYVYQTGHHQIGDLKFENYEEYLHSYDSEDNYNLQTSFVDYTQQGLKWGFQSNRVSVNMHASPIKLDPIDLLVWKPDPKDFISDKVRYDYFHENDGTNYYIYSHDGSSWHDAECGTGLDFTIRAANAHNLTVTDMGAVPQSAYEYCLSKNKFHEDADGNHSMIVRWYLPDVYELNSLFLDSNTSADMAKDAYYWSSQPSSTDYGLASIGGDIGEALKDYSIKNEVTDKARAVSKSGAIDITRETVNRIRCFYNTNGESMDMSERVPSGLGGLIKVPMKAYVSYSNTNPVYGYFSAWLTDIDDENPQQNTPSKKNHNFPTGADAEDLDHFVSNNVYYYEQDPTTSGAWKYSTLNYFGNTLYSYPGLTIKEVVLNGLRSVEGTNDKKYERSVTEIGGEKIGSMPSTDELSIKPLDYLEDTNILTISFSNGTNGSKSPSYSYRREEKSKVTYSQRWILPKYEQININETTGSVVPRVQVDLGEYTAYELSSNKANYEYVYKGVTHLVTGSYKEGSIFSRKYYFDLGPKTVNRPGYKYVAGTGGWGNKNGELGKEDSSSPSTTIDTKYDKLEFFGGNSFTITAKSGYRIKSIKVNFSDDNNVKNILGGNLSYRNLRLVVANQSLPTTSSPAYMSYSGDGESGWYQWTAPTVTEYATSVTLKLVAYTPTSVSLRPTSYEYEDASQENGYQSDFETSIVIDSFEIRIEEVDESTFTE